MKKSIRTSLLFVLATSLLAACETSSVAVGTSVDLAATNSEKTTIRVWMDDSEGAYMSAIIDAFQAENPNILVEFQTMGTVDSRERLKTYGPSGNGADIFQFPHDHLAIAVQEDLVYALPTAVKDSLTPKMAEVGMDIATLCYDETSKSFECTESSTERLYAVPTSLETVALYYNVDLLASLGKTTADITSFEKLLEIVEDWNSSLTADTTDAEDRTNADAGYYGLGLSAGGWNDPYFVQAIFSSFGFRPFGPTGSDNSAVGFADTLGAGETVEAFQNGVGDALTWMYNDLKPLVTGNGGTVSSVNGAGNFENGLIPFVIAGPWNINTYKTKSLNFAMMDIPSINGVTARPFAGAQMVAVYKNSQHVAEAIKFAEFLASEEAMEIQFQYKGKFPALKDVSTVAGVSDDPLMLAIANQLKVTIPMPTIPQVTYYWGPANTLLTKVWTGSNIEDSCEEAEGSYLTGAGLAG